MKKPLVSVLMAVYNGEAFLREAIKSILDQTYDNFELIVINDGSTDSSEKIVKDFSDKRIRYIHHSNMGLPASLNKGLKLAKGAYIARMDCDDISYPRRLEQQVRFLEQNKEVGLVGSTFDIINEEGVILETSYHLTRDEDIKVEYLVRNPFGHGTIMGKREVFDRVGGYNEKSVIEDYDIWWRISKVTNVANLPGSLYGWRVVLSGMSHGGSEKRQHPIHELMSEIWSETPHIQISRKFVREGTKFYSKLGPEYKSQYLHMICAVCLGSFRLRRYRTFAVILLIIMPSANAMMALLNFARDPSSHNYNLRNIYTDK